MQDSNINSLDRNSFIPTILQHPRDLLRALMAHHSRHKVQTRIQSASHAPRRDHPQSAQPQARSPRITLPPLHALLPGITPLPRNTLPPAIRPLRQNERILFEVIAQIEARVVDDVILLHHIRLLQISPPRRIPTDNLHLRVIIRMRRRREPLQNTRLGKEHTPRADGHERAFLAGVRELEFREGLDEGDGFCGGRGVEDGVDGRPAGDNKDVVVGEVIVGGFVVDVGFYGEAGGGGDALGGGGDGGFEGFGVC